MIELKFALQLANTCALKKVMYLYVLKTSFCNFFGLVSGLFCPRNHHCTHFNASHIFHLSFVNTKYPDHYQKKSLRCWRSSEALIWPFVGLPHYSFQEARLNENGCLHNEPNNKIKPNSMLSLMILQLQW